jgi:hypothetical protein
MKVFLMALMMFLFSIGMISFTSVDVQASNPFAFMCGSGSSCELCISPSGKDTSDDRKACENLGCKISGTTSYSGAANIKVCK